MYHKTSLAELSHPQIKKLLTGQRIRVKFGPKHPVALTREQHKKLHSAHKKGAGMTMEFGPEQIGMHQHLLGGNFPPQAPVMAFKGEGIFSDIGDKLKKVGKKIPVNDLIGFLPVDEAKNYAQDMAKKAIISAVTGSGAPRRAGRRGGRGFFDNLRNAFDPNRNGVAQAFQPVAQAFAPNGPAEQFGKNVASELIHRGIPLVGSVAGNALGDALGGPIAGQILGKAGAYGGEKLGDLIGSKTGYGVKKHASKPKKKGGALMGAGKKKKGGALLPAGYGAMGMAMGAPRRAGRRGRGKSESDEEKAMGMHY